MDELIKSVADRAGINPEQAHEAVAAVLEFVKGKMPMIGDQLKGMLEGSGNNSFGGLVDKLGGLLGK